MALDCNILQKWTNTVSPKAVRHRRCAVGLESRWTGTVSVPAGPVRRVPFLQNVAFPYNVSQKEKMDRQGRVDRLS